MEIKYLVSRVEINDLLVAERTFNIYICVYELTEFCVSLKAFEVLIF